MKVSRSSDCSFNFKFNNIQVDLCYPLIRCSLDNLAFKIDTEISYYKFDYKEVLSIWLSDSGFDYIFTFKLLGFGFIFTYSIKDIQH